MLSSGLSKVTALTLQGIAIPLVYHALGSHQYALYLLLTAALATIALMQMGAGPGLSQAIAKAHAQNDHHEEAGALASAFLFIAGSSVVGAAVISIVVRLVPSSILFGANFASDRAEIIHTVNVCVVVMAATLILGLVDSALAGYQEQVITNLGTCVANLVSAGLLLLVCYRGHPSIAEVVLVLYGLVALSRLFNLLVLLARRPYLSREAGI